MEGPDGSVVLTGENVVAADANYVVEDMSTIGVTVVLDEAGAAAFEQATRMYVGQCLPIYVGDALVSAPRVMQPISGGRFNISVSDDSPVHEQFQWAESLLEYIMPAPLPLDWDRAAWTREADFLTVTIPRT